ncbi:unnamed protein product, partial [Mesorhabditis spiculigera]
MPGVDVTYVLFTIVLTSRSHKELVIIGFMCIADASHALATLNSGSVRLWLSVHDLDDIQILNTECIRYVFPVIFLYSYQLMGASTMAVSIDRCIAVMKLGLYRGLTNQFSFVTIAGLTVAAEFLCVVLPDVFLTFNPFGLASWQVVWYICGVSKGVVNVLLVTSRHEEIVKVLQQKFRSLTGQASTGTAVTSMNYRSKN